MEPNSEQLAARIAATRDELSDNLEELGHRMKDAVDWANPVSKTYRAIPRGGGRRRGAAFSLRQFSQYTAQSA